MSDPMDGHKCIKIAQVKPCGTGRDIWLGELLEPIKDYPTETHCLHVKTPAKDLVFGVHNGDLCLIAVLAQITNGMPVNQRWLATMEKTMRIDDAS